MIVLALGDANCEPSETLPVGALIESAPAVRVKLVEVTAPAGRTIAAARMAKVPTMSKNFRDMGRVPGASR